MIGEEITRIIALAVSGTMAADPSITKIHVPWYFDMAVEAATLTYGPPCEKPMQPMNQKEATAAGLELYSYEAIRPMSANAPGRADCTRCEWPKYLHGRTS